VASSESAASHVVACEVCGTKNRVPAAADGVPRCGKCGNPLPWLADALDDSVSTVVDAAKLPVVLDLWAPWCGPCRMVSPALEQLARDYRGRIKLVKVNVDQAPRTQMRFGVQAIPTLLVLDQGREVSRQIGAAPPPRLREWLEKALDSLPSTT
jgi:thioredoxin 2